jgi:hypothetical protein
MDGGIETARSSCKPLISNCLTRESHDNPSIKAESHSLHPVCQDTS